MKLERAVVEVFGGCNYSCSMCPQSGAGRGKDWTRKMPLKLFKKILDQLPGNPIINLEGSGEPTLSKDLPEYIRACMDRGFKSFVYTNGSRFKGQFMQDCIDAGLSFIRFSVIGDNAQEYRKWMGNDNYYMIHDHIRSTKEYIDESESDCIISSYHLITNRDREEWQASVYQSKIEELGIIGYVWKMHNWSGNYAPEYNRNGLTKKTCGRPFAPEITIRAGGLDGKQAAVTPCCQTMGPPNEDKSVLGHFQDQSFDEIWNGDKYNELRIAHENEDWPEYCNDCDFLIDDPNVLVWTNDKDCKQHKMLGATDLSLYRK